MPAELLFDLSRLNFSRPRFTADDVRKVLPHRSHMALLDAVVAYDDETKTIVGYKDVRANEFWCDGHFPGHPLLPGVLMIETGAQLAVFGYKLAVPEIAERLVVFGGVDEVRFRGAVRPGDRLVVISRGVSFNRRLAKSACQGVVGDKIVFEAIILGIPT